MLKEAPVTNKTVKETMESIGLMLMEKYKKHIRCVHELPECENSTTATVIADLKTEEQIVITIEVKHRPGTTFYPNHKLKERIYGFWGEVPFPGKGNDDPFSEDYDKED